MSQFVLIIYIIHILYILTFQQKGQIIFIHPPKNYHFLRGVFICSDAAGQALTPPKTEVRWSRVDGLMGWVAVSYIHKRLKECFTWKMMVEPSGWNSGEGAVKLQGFSSFQAVNQDLVEPIPPRSFTAKASEKRWLEEKCSGWIGKLQGVNILCKYQKSAK